MSKCSLFPIRSMGANTHTALKKYAYMQWYLGVGHSTVYRGCFAAFFDIIGGIRHKLQAALFYRLHSLVKAPRDREGTIKALVHGITATQVSWHGLWRSFGLFKFKITRHRAISPSEQQQNLQGAIVESWNTHTCRPCHLPFSS